MSDKHVSLIDDAKRRRLFLFPSLVNACYSPSLTETLPEVEDTAFDDNNAPCTILFFIRATTQTLWFCIQISDICIERTLDQLVMSVQVDSPLTCEANQQLLMSQNPVVDTLSTALYQS